MEGKLQFSRCFLYWSMNIYKIILTFWRKIPVDTLKLSDHFRRNSSFKLNLFFQKISMKVGCKLKKHLKERKYFCWKYRKYCRQSVIIFNPFFLQLEDIISSLFQFNLQKICTTLQNLQISDIYFFFCESLNSTWIKWMMQSLW